MVYQELVNYIQSQIGKGLYKNAIKNQLVQKGWKETDIRDGFLQVIPKDEYDKVNIYSLDPLPTKESKTSVLRKYFITILMFLSWFFVVLSIIYFVELFLRG